MASESRQARGQHQSGLRYLKSKFTLLTIFWIASLPAEGSTCSCAGVPLLGAMEMASPNNDQWFMGVTYEYHDVSDLVSGSSSVPDTTGRDRTAQAFIVEVSRGLTNNWSLSALMSAVEHERIVGGVKDRASGIGDAVLMLKYAPAIITPYSRNALAFGLGSRIPVGVDDADRSGIILAEDMQPSTGAFGAVAWMYAGRALNQADSARIFANISHTLNGTNDREYQFGHETTIAIGGSYWTQSPFALNLQLLYRHAERDRRNSVEIPNTGGQWLDIVPAIQYHVTDTFAVGASAKIPLKRDLNDQLQFTTKYAFRLSFSYVFGN